MTNKIKDLPLQSGFWDGFNLEAPPSFEGKRVLEIGCGRGGRCFQILRLGAARVVGIDIHEPSIAIGHSCLGELTPEERNRFDLMACDIDGLTEGDFDIVISEDAFEHIMDVDQALVGIHSKLAEGGKAFLGFGPLYFSPFGDHNWMRQILPFRQFFPWPWGHLLFSQKYIFRKLSEKHDQQISDTVNWPYQSLNKLTVDDFIDRFDASPLTQVSINLNPAASLTGKLMKAASRVRPIRKYFTWGIYTVLGRFSGHSQEA